MENLVHFKNSFFLGRLIWAIGKRSERLVKVRKMLSDCHIHHREILSLNALQFIDMLGRGLPESIVEQHEVILVRDFESLDSSLIAIFLSRIKTMLELQMGLNMRIVLVSGRRIPSELNEFSELSPTVVSLDDSSDDPGDINLKVHNYLEQAMRMSNIPVIRMSERAAEFLEYYAVRSQAPDVVELLLLGLFRSDRKILRFKDLLPDLWQDMESSQDIGLRKLR